jgi:predicted ArsR family transcriptional regulator
MRSKGAILLPHEIRIVPGPEPKYSDAELLREIRLLPDPVVTAKEITGNVELENATVNRRLDRLVNDGYLEEKKVGAAAVVYWMTSKGRNKASEA